MHHLFGAAGEHRLEGRSGNTHGKGGIGVFVMKAVGKQRQRRCLGHEGSENTWQRHCLTGRPPIVRVEMVYTPGHKMTETNPGTNRSTRATRTKKKTNRTKWKTKTSTTR